MNLSYKIPFKKKFLDEFFYGKKRRKIEALLLLNLTILFLWYSLQIHPFFKKYQVAKKNFITQTALCNLEQKKLMLLEKVKLNGKDIKKQKIVIDEQSERLLILTKLAEEHQIVIKAAKSQIKSVKGLSGVHLILTGNYWHLYAWLHDAMYSPLLLRIEQFSFTGVNTKKTIILDVIFKTGVTTSF